MELVLFRHGIAIDRGEPHCPSEEKRYLTSEGEKRTRLAAKGLRTLGLKPDLILSSPLVRTMQTAAIAAEVLGYPVEAIEEWPELAFWEDPQATILRLRMTKADQVLLVGHRPHLDELLAGILGFEEDSFTTLKKAGAAMLVWTPPHGELRWIMPPKALRFLGSRG